MTIRRAGLRLGGGLLALLFAWTGIASAKQWYRCPVDGQARPACCCPAATPGGDEPAAPAVTAGGCCDREVIEATGHPAGDTHTTVTSHLAGAPAPTQEVIPSPPASAVRAVRPGDDARTGPSILLAKHSLLR